MQSQVDSANLKRRNKKLVVVIVVLAVVATLAVAPAIGLVIGSCISQDDGTVPLPPPMMSRQSQPCGDYPFTSLRKVTDNDVAGLSPRELRIMRNEIYARHGYIFDSADLHNYFMEKRWYNPVTKDVNLSAIEKYNVEFIKQYEW